MSADKGVLADKVGIDLKIITPNGVVFREKVDYLKVKTPDGEMAFLKNHENYIALLIEGNLLIKKDGEQIDYATVGGSLLFEDNNATILTQFADTPDNLNEILKKRVEMLSQVYEEDVLSNTELQKAEMALRRFLMQKGDKGGY